MRQQQIDKIKRGLKKGFDVIAGDYVEYYPPSGPKKGLLTIMYDLKNEDGLDYNMAGMLNQGVRELLFLNDYLIAQGVTIQPGGYFTILGKRWDLVEGEDIQEAIVPISGIHNLTMVRVRRSIEVQSEKTGTTWGWSQ